MDIRTMSLDYYSLTIRDFKKRYRIGYGKARKIFGEKNGLSARDKSTILELCEKTKLLPNEVIRLLETHTATEIKQGYWTIKEGYPTFIPSNLYNLGRNKQEQQRK